MTIAGHTFTPDTSIDSVALSNSGRCIFLARWHDPVKGDRAAIFAANRIVVHEGDTVDGKFIQVLPKHAKIAVNDDGTVAYEAISVPDYKDGNFAFGYDSIFVKDHQIFSIQSTALDEIPDFVLTEEGTVEIKTARTATSPISASVPASRATKKKRPSLFDVIHPPRLPKGFEIPAGLKSKGLSAKPSKTKPPAQLESDTCPLPDFPLPSHWSASGGIASHASEPPVPGRMFKARIPYMRGPYKNAFRVVYFGSDCLPKLIVIGDSSLAEIGSIIAVYSAYGLLTYIDPDGFLVFAAEGGPIQAETDVFLKPDSPISMNANGDILFPVKWLGQTALLLGNPIHK